jgi:hypothetical protein
MAAGAKYFVRSSNDAPEKGPYAPDQLAKSYEKGLLGAKATARREDSDEWLLLKDVVAALPRNTKSRARSDENDAHALAAVRPRRGVHPLVWVGVLTGVAGVVLMAVFAPSGSSESPWPLTMIVVGAYIAVRWLIRGAIRRDDG